MTECDHKVERIDFEGQDKIGVCVICGRRRLYDPAGASPPKVISEGVSWDRLSHNKKHEFYEQHREEMILDYWSGKEGKRDGRDKMVREKWGVLSGTWVGLKKLWGLPVTPRSKANMEPKDSSQNTEDTPQTSRRKSHGVVRLEFGAELGKMIIDQARRYSVTPGSLARIIVAQWFEKKEREEK